MLTVYATAVLWTQWNDLHDRPITVLLPLPVGEMSLDLKKRQEDKP